MSTEVVMPQMGESIAEGTITKWLKKVGERVERDEPLFEISTDKVDAEIPSPAAGTLTEIRFNEGDTVEVNKVVAVLDGDGATTTAEPPKKTQQESVPKATTEEVPKAETPPAPPPQPPTPQPAPVVQKPAPAATAPRAAEVATPISAKAAAPKPAKSETVSETVEDLRRTKSSPLVRRIAEEHGVDITQLEGTGMSGRVTKNDILSFIESGATAPAVGPTTAPPSPLSLPEPAAPPPPKPLAGDRVEQMSVMRKKIAEHMVLSRRTSAHVTTVYEIDMTAISKLRE